MFGRKPKIDIPGFPVINNLQENRTHVRFFLFGGASVRGGKDYRDGNSRTRPQEDPDRTMQQKNHRHPHGGDGEKCTPQQQTLKFSNLFTNFHIIVYTTKCLC